MKHARLQKANVGTHNMLTNSYHCEVGKTSNNFKFFDNLKTGKTAS